MKKTTINTIIKTIVMGIMAVPIVWVATKTYQYDLPGDIPKIFFHRSPDNEISYGNPPENLQSATISGTNNTFHLTGMCLIYEFRSAPLSDELVQVLNDWLTETRY